jgi:hypothetical protein
VVLQAALQTKRDRTQALLVERELELEEKTARLMEEERARNDMQNRAMYELLVVSFFYIFPKSCT